MDEKSIHEIVYSPITDGTSRGGKFISGAKCSFISVHGNVISMHENFNFVQGNFIFSCIEIKLFMP